MAANYRYRLVGQEEMARGFATRQQAQRYAARRGITDYTLCRACELHGQPAAAGGHLIWIRGSAAWVGYP